MSSTTTFSRHPSSAVLLDHVTGTLGFAHHLVVATHTTSCAECQHSISFLERIGDALQAGLQPVAPPPDLSERCLASIALEEPSSRLGAVDEPDSRLELGDTVLPPSLDGLTPGRLRWLAPGIRHSMLWRDHTSTLHFIRVRAGVMLPAHRHRGLELTCVLSGAFRAGDRHYAAGDVSEEDDDEESLSRRTQDHLVVAESEEDCVCIMATTGRLRFSGWMARLLQPVMPL